MEHHQKKLLARARELGMTVIDHEADWGLDAATLEYQGQRQLVMNGRVFSSLNFHAEKIAWNKHAGKQFLKSIGVRVPEGILIRDPHAVQDQIQALLDQHGPMVCKPLDSEDGRGILIGVEDVQGVMDHMADHDGVHGTGAYVLEQLAPGHDLRIQAVGGRLVAGCVRKPACIVGDGVSDVRTLIDKRNLVLKGFNPENGIDIDHQVHDLLQQRGFNLDSIIPDGMEVRVKKVSNMTQGGSAVDVTDQIHPEYHAWMIRLGEALNLRFYALDIMTTDHRLDPNEHAMALEISSRPEWAHHTFSDHRQHDMAYLILKDLFNLTEA